MKVMYNLILLLLPILKTSCGFGHERFSLSNPICVVGFLLIFGGLLSCNGLKEQLSPADQVFKVKNLNQLATLEASVVKILSASDNETWYKMGNRKVLFSCEGSVKAGVDLSKLKKENIRVENMNVEILLPPAEVFMLKIDPNRIEEVYSDVGFLRGDFTNSEKETIFQMGQKKIEESLPDLGILKQAEINASVFLTGYIKALGFKSVQIKFSSI